jgi:hypothetical protein
MGKYKIILVVIIVISTLLPIAGHEYKTNFKKVIASEGQLIKQGEVKAQKKSGLLEKSSFSIKLPEGWDEINTEQSTTTAMVVYLKEAIEDPVAQQKNFRSYYSIIGGATEDQSPINQVEKLKKNLSDKINGIIFSQETANKINGHEAYSLELKFTQQGADLRVLIVFVEGKDNEIWRLSFNSIESQWIKNKSLFYQLAGSFVVKN